MVSDWQLFKMYDRYNTTSDHPTIPQQAFLFLPFRAQSISERDDFRVGEGSKVRRLLFEGWAQDTYSPLELEKLKELDDYIARKQLTLGEGWDKCWRMRWHQSTGFKVKKTIEDMRQFDGYQLRVRELSLSSTAVSFLNRGIYYVAGRDCHFRPILVFDVKKVIDLDMREEDIMETQVYFFEYVIRQLLIPGQVENWVSIIDCGLAGLFPVVGAMKKNSTFLSETYRSRLFVLYITRVPTSLSIVWTMVKPFLEEQTIRKINFFDEQLIPPLLDHAHPSQFEAKFGGKLPDIEEQTYWPPKEVSPVYNCERMQTRLLSKEEYIDHHDRKIFYQTKFQEQLLFVPKTNADLRINEHQARAKVLDRQFRRRMEVAQEDSLSRSCVPAMSMLTYGELVRQSVDTEAMKETVKK